MTVGSKVKQTWSTLKGVKGTLDIYAFQSQDEEVKTAFQEAAEIIGEILGDLDGRVQKLEFEEPQYKGF